MNSTVDIDGYPLFPVSLGKMTAYGQPVMVDGNPRAHHIMGVRVWQGESVLQVDSGNKTSEMSVEARRRGSVIFVELLDEEGESSAIQIQFHKGDVYVSHVFLDTCEGFTPAVWEHEFWRD